MAWLNCTINSCGARVECFHNDVSMVTGDALVPVSARLSSGTDDVFKISNGLAHDCSISSAHALEIPQSCAKPAITTYL